MCVQNLKFVALPVPEIIGGIQKIGQSPDTPTLLFLQNLEWVLFGWTLWNVPAKFEVRSFTHEITPIEILGVANPQCWGREGRRGSEMVPFERALVSSYRPSMLTFYTFTRFRDIAAFVLQYRPLHHFFPTPPLVSPKFPHVLLRVGGWPLGYEEWRCWANCPCNYFPRFPTYVILIHQDERTTCILNTGTALCTIIVHRSVKTTDKLWR